MERNRGLLLRSLIFIVGGIVLIFGGIREIQILFYSMPDISINPEVVRTKLHDTEIYIFKSLQILAGVIIFIIGIRIFLKQRT